uniref:Uncharacterized protein n=1 Tax=Noccaea caerulescens TaxID=107243 RepID=A0A1J3DX51_NOCCA
MWSACIFVLHMKIFDDSLVDEDREGDAENSDESEVATGPAEIMLEILPGRSPVLDELVLVRFHSSTHLLRFLDLPLSLLFSSPKSPPSSNGF